MVFFMWVGYFFCVDKTFFICCFKIAICRKIRIEGFHKNKLEVILNRRAE